MYLAYSIRFTPLRFIPITVHWAAPVITCTAVVGLISTSEDMLAQCYHRKISKTVTIFASRSIVNPLRDFSFLQDQTIGLPIPGGGA